MADRGIYMEIENLSEILDRFDKAPEKFLNVCKTCMKEGGKQVAKEIRGKAPSRFKRLVGYKMSLGQMSKDNYVFMGFFNKDRKKDLKSIPDWFKAYWKNYGTLTKRYGGHDFRTPIKSAKTSSGSKRRNNVGQDAELWFERIIPGWDKTYVDAFTKKLKENEDKLL